MKNTNKSIKICNLSEYTPIVILISDDHFHQFLWLEELQNTRMDYSSESRIEWLQLFSDFTVISFF